MRGLKEVNLMVGKNSSGKSRTLNALARTVLFLRQLNSFTALDTVSVEMSFLDGEERLDYAFKCENGAIVYEHLANESGTLIERNSKDVATIQGEIINPPSGSLVLHVRRDTKNYPYIEKIVSWAEQSCHMPFNETDSWRADDSKIYLNGTRSSLAMMFKSLDDLKRKEVLAQARELDYQLERITVLDIANHNYIRVKEKGVPHMLLLQSLSKGIHRVLFLLVYLQCLSEMQSASILLIDDFCEGLDYSRARKFGKMLFDFCGNHGIQLIVSTNDHFLMDAIELDNWHILVREGSVVRCINTTTNPDIFLDFSMTGLNNFDLFSSDYIKNHLKSSKG